jgi:hypothetical protein
MVISIAACGGGTATTPPAVVPTPTPAASAQAALTLPPLPGFSFSTGGNGAVDPSTIVTMDMASTIIGGTLTKTLGNLGAAGLGTVVYSNAAGDSVSVIVEVVPGGFSTAALQAAMQYAGSQGSLVPISGLGEAAAKEVTANGATVAFVKGSNLVLIEATSSTTAGTDLEPKVESLAQQVAGKL